jgi:hypothetical protein
MLPAVLHRCEILSHPKGKTQAEGVWEQTAEENIWT